MIPEYLVAQLKQALAEDARTNVLDLQVRLRAGCVYLSGSVESEDRRQAAEEVVRELIPPGTVIRNELSVAEYGRPMRRGSRRG